MRQIEIPLLRESAAFAARLVAATRSFGESKYQFHRRVNWSHRYEVNFYALESDCFQSDPDAYLAGHQQIATKLADVFALKLSPKQLVTVVMKVAAHWLFLFVGRFADKEIRLSGIPIYRKAYVDDIELVFDPNEAGVLRAVYPFPLNIHRQWRYLIFLHKTGYNYKFAGIPYLLKDLLRVLVRRDVRSLQRLESRGQVRHAKQVLSLGVKAIQLSDEFDIGSLDFVRTLARYPAKIVNSAHGVGKYLPVHAYPVFCVLTHRQAQYYYAVRQCDYRIRTLNIRISPVPTTASKQGGKLIRIVFLGQTFRGVNEVISTNQERILRRLDEEFGGDAAVQLYYKPHPTSNGNNAAAGFNVLTDINLVNGLDGTVFVSLFSTCQIDPNFRGRKILVRSQLIHPEIAFDDSEEILILDKLITLVRDMILAAKTACL